MEFLVIDVLLSSLTYLVQQRVLQILQLVNDVDGCCRVESEGQDRQGEGELGGHPGLHQLVVTRAPKLGDGR